MREACTHLGEIRKVTPSAEGCEECLKIGDTWVHLRLCLICGHVGCCDQSKNKHATKHFHATRHPVIKSFQPDEDWGWCYVDTIFIEPEGLYQAYRRDILKGIPVR
jgi:uncharacterized UBP type Zn finger protein